MEDKPHCVKEFKCRECGHVAISVIPHIHNLPCECADCGKKTAYPIRTFEKEEEENEPV